MAVSFYFLTSRLDRRRSIRRAASGSWGMPLLKTVVLGRARTCSYNVNQDKGGPGRINLLIRTLPQNQPETNGGHSREEKNDVAKGYSPLDSTMLSSNDLHAFHNRPLPSPPPRNGPHQPVTVTIQTPFHLQLPTNYGTRRITTSRQLKFPCKPVPKSRLVSTVLLRLMCI